MESGRGVPIYVAALQDNSSTKAPLWRTASAYRMCKLTASMHGAGNHCFSGDAARGGARRPVIHEWRSAPRSVPVGRPCQRHKGAKAGNASSTSAVAPREAGRWPSCQHATEATAAAGGCGRPSPGSYETFSSVLTPSFCMSNAFRSRPPYQWPPLPAHHGRQGRQRQQHNDHLAEEVELRTIAAVQQRLREACGRSASPARPP